MVAMGMDMQNLVDKNANSNCMELKEGVKEKEQIP